LFYNSEISLLRRTTPKLSAILQLAAGFIGAQVRSKPSKCDEKGGGSYPNTIPPRKASNTKAMPRREVGFLEIFKIVGVQRAIRKSIQPIEEQAPVPSQWQNKTSNVLHCGFVGRF